jgi:uncharacterized FlaG/YvyC family protein
MDVNGLIANTIMTLSQPQQAGYHTGEITIADAETGKSMSGGRDASREEIDKALDTLNGAASSVDNRVSFEYNEKTKRLVMRMTDPMTHEVVRQLPSKDALRILENIHDMLGVFIDEQR